MHTVCHCPISFLKKLNPWTSVIGALLLCFLSCGKDSQAQPSEQQKETLAAPASRDAEAPDSNEIHLQNIRQMYGKAMQMKKQSREMDCNEEPLTLIVDVRKAGGDILWIRKASGYDHGVASYEALYHKKEVLFVMKELRTWNFDPENPPEDDGTSHTVDRGEQHRYYFLDGTLVRSLYKEASAHSSRKESLDAQLQNAANKAHPSPDAGVALEMARRMLSLFESGGLKADWCSISD